MKGIGLVTTPSVGRRLEAYPIFQHRPEDELVWEYENIDLKIAFRHAQAGWVVKTWSID
jgi:hypothetical protein